MRASSKTYENVAKNCSAFRAKDCSCGASNSSADFVSGRSCTNCNYFDKDEFCTLDLYDKIVNEHNFKES